MGKLDEYWAKCNRSMLEDIASIYEFHFIKPYDAAKIAVMRDALKEYGYADFAGHPDGAELASFMRGKFPDPEKAKPKDRRGASEMVGRGPLELKTYSKRKPSDETLGRIEKTLVHAQEIMKSVVEFLQGIGAVGDRSLLEKVLAFHFKISPGDAKVLDTYFPKILHVYRVIFGNLHAPIRITDALGRHRQESGYVNRHKVDEVYAAGVSPRKTVLEVEKGFVVMGSIHITFERFLDKKTLLNHTILGETELAALLIHEASHKFCDTKDHAYTHETLKYAKLTTIEAVDNADSYAYAAISIFCKTLIER